MKLLAIESSCDETAAAVIEDGRKILSSVVFSQIDIHKEYGGVVPEIASRYHIEKISQIVESALREAEVTPKDLDGVAVTAAPGLIGALLVGVNFAKGFCFTHHLPLIPVHHLRGHIAANFLAHPSLEPPFLALVVSGGHSHIIEVSSYTDYKVIGHTRDDAAGEAFDKVSRVLGLGYPGGVQIEKAAVNGDIQALKLPITEFEDTPFDFSFSGLKTKMINYIHNSKQTGTEINISDVAASFNYTVAKTLTDKFIAAAKQFGSTKLVLAGGVAANKMLRNMLTEKAKEINAELHIPDISLCGDNAAMIASQAYYEFLANNIADETLNGYATMSIG